MNRLVPVLLILLVISFGGFATYKGIQNQQTLQEKIQLKSDLDATAKQLANAQQENMRLQGELTQTQNKVTTLENDVTTLQNQVKDLEANITALRKELHKQALRDGAMTIGLSFFWHPSISPQVDKATLLAIVDRMNEIWGPFRIYYFIYTAEADGVTPLTIPCGTGTGSSSTPSEVFYRYARQLYPPSDIPIAIVNDITSLDGLIRYAGCGLYGDAGISIKLSYINHAKIVPASQILSHEWLHDLGFTDTEITAQMGNYVDVIPITWLPRIQVAVQQFQMPLP